ncbi:MAG TPA: hypothetical protein VMG62_03965 [Solirubrobacteraceae bacterium]|nr:hypothetical protein [Solirubrobacteraceae bacterium]
MSSQPTEQELREAYETELSRIASPEMILQAAVSLLNIAGYRLAASRQAPDAAETSASAAASSPGAASPSAAADLDQARDAIDAVRALLPILERTRPAAELAPLREALSQLQMAYARDAAAPPSGEAGPSQPPQPPAPGAEPSGGSQPGQAQPGQEPAKGPAEASGRLWVPGR